MKKVIIVGAGAGQIPMIRLCKEKDAYVIVIGPEGDYPGFALADKVYYKDTRDKESILEIAREEGIDAIFTDQTDVAVPTVAYVADKLGLKGIGYDTSLKFTDKYVMRKAAKEIGVCVPQFELIRSEEEAVEKSKQLMFPIIMKPTNSCGSRGICKIFEFDENEIREAFRRSSAFSSNHETIMEEFIEGEEFIADGFALDHKYINLDLGIKQYFAKADTYISKMCMFSSADLIEEEKEKKVLEANKKLVEGLGLEFGITHGEYIYCPKDQNVYLVEIAARGGGVYLSSHLTPKASGVNTNEMLVDFLLNGTVVDLSGIRLDKKVAAWRCFELEEGEIVSIENADKLIDIDGVDKVCLDDLYVGKHVDKLTDDTKKHGPILVSGNDRQTCFDILKKVENTLKVTVSHNVHVSGIIW